MLRSTSPVRYHAEIIICFPKKTFSGQEFTSFSFAGIEILSVYKFGSKVRLVESNHWQFVINCEKISFTNQSVAAEFYRPSRLMHTA